MYKLHPADSQCCISVQHVHAASTLGIFMLHVLAEFLCCMSALHAHINAAYLCRVNLHVQTACPCWMSILHIHAACPCRMSKSRVWGIFKPGENLPKFQQNEILAKKMFNFYEISAKKSLSHFRFAIWFQRNFFSVKYFVYLKYFIYSKYFVSAECFVFLWNITFQGGILGICSRGEHFEVVLGHQVQ